MDKEDDYTAVKNLKAGEEVCICMSDGGGARVYHKGDSYHLYEISLYGGTEIFERSFPIYAGRELVDEVWSWA